MRIRQVDFPDEVIRALRTGNLVIFAGAGVSIDPPSSLPGFDGLAAHIGGAIHPRQEHEAVDRYLGRLKEQGVKVHAQVRAILASPASQPNALHESLIALFRPGGVRLVTTNFDPHFTSAAVARLALIAPKFSRRRHCRSAVNSPAWSICTAASINRRSVWS